MNKEGLILKLQKEIDLNTEIVKTSDDVRTCVAASIKRATIFNILKDIKNLSGETVKLRELSDFKKYIFKSSGMPYQITMRVIEEYEKSLDE